MGEQVLDINVKLDEGAYLPEKAHEDDAGFDLRLPSTYTWGALIYKGESIIIDTGVHFQIPHGYVGMLKSKSGLNVRNGITGEGVIDAGYTGSVVAKLCNNGNYTVDFRTGDKIIQIVFLPIPDVKLHIVETFPETERGDNGFGSTGR